MRAFCRLRREDDGLGMIVVLGIMGLVSMMVITATLAAMTSLRSARSRVSNEQALAAAENGIDFGLARLQRAFDDYNADYPIPSQPNSREPSPACRADSVADPGAFASADAERAWVRTHLADLLAQHPECVQRGGQGEYLVLKPSTPLVNGRYPKYGRVYSVGWAPSRGASNAVARVVKAEYIFMPFRPTHAVLTGGDLVIDSSTTVTAAYGVDPAMAAVHTNGVVSQIHGNPTVTGPVTSTRTSSGSSNRFLSNPGGTVGSKATQRIPRISARALYFQASSVSPSVTGTGWYDLCPNGDVKPYSTNGPCQSATVLNSGSPTYRGWSYTSSDHLWVASRNTQSGIYFVHQGNVDVGPGNGSMANLTVIASAQNPDNCSSKRYGNIRWDHFAIDAPAYPNLFFYADADLVTGANFTAGHGTTSPPVTSGMFVAGDQMQLETSSAGAVGSVVAGDACASSDWADHNEVKNPTVWYDPNSDSPFTSVISTTLWLEYQGVAP